MACAATLKRSLEFDPVHSPSHTHSNAKRRRCMPMTMSQSSPSAVIQKSLSPFSSVTPKLSSEKICATIAQEMKKMQRRRQLAPSSMVTQDILPLSPSQSGKSFDSPPRSSSPETSPSMSPSITNVNGSNLKKDAPLFTFRQVGLICERLLKERDEEVKEQYDKVLNCKLAEQYESFLKFNHDQLHNRFGDSEMSYVS